MICDSPTVRLVSHCFTTGTNSTSRTGRATKNITQYQSYQFVYIAQPSSTCTRSISILIFFDLLVGESGGIVCGKNQVFARQKRQPFHSKALSSCRQNAISFDPSVGDKVESLQKNSGDHHRLKRYKVHYESVIRSENVAYVSRYLVNLLFT